MDVEDAVSSSSSSVLLLAFFACSRGTERMICIPICRPLAQRQEGREKREARLDIRVSFFLKKKEECTYVLICLLKIG